MALATVDDPIPHDRVRKIVELQVEAIIKDEARS